VTQTIHAIYNQLAKSLPELESKPVRTCRRKSSANAA
jgi:hypothetical protein